MLYRDEFRNRHTGATLSSTDSMLSAIGVAHLDALIDATIPASIRLTRPLQLPRAATEVEMLAEAEAMAATNIIGTSYIGMGYYGTITPPTIQRNILENPGWYTQYTPYQAEISQGRLESLLNFQTMIMDLTGMQIANASLLDEATAAAEAMHLMYAAAPASKKDAAVLLVDENVFPQTLNVLHTRAQPLGIVIKTMPWKDFNFGEDVFGCYVQYPAADGSLHNYTELCDTAHQAQCLVTVGADLLSLTLLTPPAEFGADIAIGTTQRFGVPMGFGGPHAAYFATKETYKRLMPGRIIGVSVDAQGNTAYRMALQTREQHIRRDKATSNICTAQALLANMAAMYAVYHGPQGLRGIASRIHTLACTLADGLQELGYSLCTTSWFDTVCVDAQEDTIKPVAEAEHINFRYFNNGKCVSIAVDESTTVADIDAILNVFAKAHGNGVSHSAAQTLLVRTTVRIPENLRRSSPYLEHPVFNSYHTEHELLRYMKRLENKDLSLAHSMIPLGSCTMKLNAAAQMMPITWKRFAMQHPFAPAQQVQGYAHLFRQLESWLCEITGFDACSLQPNAGAQGEYAGLLTIRRLLDATGQPDRNVVLIPASAHGTNPASAIMAGMKVVVVKSDEHGHIDVADLKLQAEKHASTLAALMVTYPSTHGVFEESIIEVCTIVHQYGGKVYMDGANMNAQVGLTSPRAIGADVCHLNLHKTFAIPHGGGGPGMGPICCTSELAPYLPGIDTSIQHFTGYTAASAYQVSAAPWGSASVLLISWAYIRMMGADGLTEATRHAILNANYLMARLGKYYSVLYTGSAGYCAHEFILDMREFKQRGGIEVEDIAKRLMDYGFHAPTVSFPVAGTLMIEPTESESLAELDRFCDAMIAIHAELEDVCSGIADRSDNMLKNAPHTQHVVSADVWSHPYSRQQAAFPLPWVRDRKFWPSAGRVDNAYGDRVLICSCPSVEEYAN